MGKLIYTAVLLLPLLGIALFFYFSANPTEDGGLTKTEAFVGESRWATDHSQQCKSPRNQYYKSHAMGCFTFLIKDSLETIKMELISRDPILIVFRRLANEGEVENFLRDVYKTEIFEQTVQGENGGKNKVSSSRRANGTWMHNEQTPGVATVYQKVTRVLRNVNFGSAEPWSILSYHPGGHYAVHYDMLADSPKETWDHWMRDYGNRWATFLVVLKTADLGGGTVFPNIETTVIPEPGDAMFWTNMNTDETKSTKSMHGACVIKEGQKIAATLWIRQKDQPVLIGAQGEKLFDPKPFLQPSSFKAQCSS